MNMDIFVMSLFFRNRKTGNIYRKLAIAGNESSGNEGQDMVVYCPCDDNHDIYCRDYKEFIEKFEPVEFVQDDKQAIGDREILDSHRIIC